MFTNDSSQALGRMNPRTRYMTKSKFSRRLKSHDRPVVTNEKFLSPDNPGDKTITDRRPPQ